VRKQERDLLNIKKQEVSTACSAPAKSLEPATERYRLPLGKWDRPPSCFRRGGH
jgi:hypothetical protein